jgi:hypothetical protein
LALETPRALLDLGVSKPVFDCRWPLTRERTEALWASRPHALYDQPYLGGQDDLHETTTMHWREWASPIVAIPGAFRFRYATQGSTAAAGQRHLDWLLRQSGMTDERPYPFPEEAESFAEVYRNTKLAVGSPDTGSGDVTIAPAPR